MSKIFVDTNILVYALDPQSHKKQKECRNLLRQLTREGQRGVISTQVLQEFYVASVKKLGVTPLVAKGMLDYFENFEVIQVSPDLIKKAVDCHILNQISFWDALVVVTAESAQCERIWTEDLNHGQTIHGVLIENPLR